MAKAKTKKKTVKKSTIIVPDIPWWDDDTTGEPEGEAFDADFAACAGKHNERVTCGAMRDNAGKLRHDYRPIEGLLELDRVVNYGAEKYEPHNWRRGRNYSETVSSAIRHIHKWELGQNTDPESGCHHLAHAAWNLLAVLSWEASHAGEDDRPSTYYTDDEIEHLFRGTGEQDLL